MPGGVSQDFPPEFDPDLPADFVTWLFSSASALTSAMRVQFLRVGPTETVLSMPVAGNTQNTGVLHGGAACVLAESAASLAACAYGWPDRIGYGTTLSARYRRPARSGSVTASAWLCRAVYRTLEYQVDLTDEHGAAISDITVTVQLVRRSSSATREPRNSPPGQ